MITINNKLRKAGELFSDILQRDTYDLSTNDDKKSDKTNSKDNLALPDTVNLHGRPSLDMSMKELRTIPKRIFKDVDLQILRLNGNFLRALPFELARLRNLEELYLQNNKLEFLPAQVCALVNLQVLDISYNEINMLPYSVSHLKNIQVLDLAYNNIKVLPESLGFLQRIEVLNIDGNSMGEINDVVFTLNNITTLKMRQNNLTVLPKQLSKLKKLRELCFSGNQITKLPESLKSFLRKIENVDMDSILKQQEIRRTTSPLLGCLKAEDDKECRNEQERERIKSIVRSGELGPHYDENDPVYQFTSYAFPNKNFSPEKETLI